MVRGGRVCSGGGCGLVGGGYAQVGGVVRWGRVCSGGGCGHPVLSWPPGSGGTVGAPPAEAAAQAENAGGGGGGGGEWQRVSTTAKTGLGSPVLVAKYGPPRPVLATKKRPPPVSAAICNPHCMSS